MIDSSQTFRDRPRFVWHAVAAALLALLLVILGWRVPLPGLAADVMDVQLLRSSTNMMARFSVFALGIGPLFTVLAGAEIAKLIFPPLARWQAAASRNADRTARIIRILVLIVAALQSYGTVIALTATGLTDRSVAGFVPMGVASLLGSTTVLIWLSEYVRLPVLRNGFWLFVALSFLSTFPGEIRAWAELLRTGAASSRGSLILVAYLAIATAMVVFANLVLSRTSWDGEAKTVMPRAVLLWPPFLASIVGGYATLPFRLLAPEMFETSQSILIVDLVLNVILIPLFVFAYARLFAAKPADAEDGLSRMPALLLIVAVQVVLSVAGGLLPRIFLLPFNLSGGLVIVLVTVILAIFQPLAYLGEERISEPGP
jgi:preprotein translocase subunit SecY